MVTKPLVSVIICFLNAEKFFCEAVESVLTQTYESWELLLVDDGSDDSSTTLARNYADRQPGRIRYLEHPRHENQGLSASRNLGARNACGTYLAFLDSDDVWLPLKLQQQVAIMESYPEAAMTYGSILYWYGWTGRPEDLDRDRLVEVAAPDPFVRPPNLFLTSTLPCPSDMMVRRDLYEQVGGFEEHFRGIYATHEDQAFFAKVALGSVIAISRDPLFRYRQHPDSLCAREFKSGKLHMARRYYLDWLGGYLAHKGVTDPRVWKSYNEALWPYRHPLLWSVHPRRFVRFAKRVFQSVARAVGRCSR